MSLRAHLGLRLGSHIRGYISRDCGLLCWLLSVRQRLGCLRLLLGLLLGLLLLGLLLGLLLLLLVHSSSLRFTCLLLSGSDVLLQLVQARLQGLQGGQHCAARLLNPALRANCLLELLHAGRACPPVVLRTGVLLLGGSASSGGGWVSGCSCCVARLGLHSMGQRSKNVRLNTSRPAAVESHDPS